MRMRTIVLLAASLVVATAGPAAAAPAKNGGSAGGWEPTSTPPFVIPAGQVCSFEVKGDIVADHEWMRTPATFPDGSPQVQDFKGVLVIRYTNTSNHRSITRDATGTIRVISLPTVRESSSSTATTPSRYGRPTPASPAATTSPTATSS